MSGRQRRRKHETQLFSALNLIFWIFFFQRVWSANLEVFQKLLVILIGLNGTKVRKSPKQILIYFPLANWFFMGYTFMYYNLALWIDMKIHVKATEQDVEILSSIIFIEPNPLSLWGEYFSQWLEYFAQKPFKKAFKCTKYFEIVFFLPSSLREIPSFSSMSSSVKYFRQNIFEEIIFPLVSTLSKSFAKKKGRVQSKKK